MQKVSYRESFFLKVQIFGYYFVSAETLAKGINSNTNFCCEWAILKDFAKINFRKSMLFKNFFVSLTFANHQKLTLKISRIEPQTAFFYYFMSIET